MKYLDLPVYKHKDLILKALETNQSVVVESPTGSGKTTQTPVILYEAGYGENGIIGVTQPRRIAALSVSEFIARQMDAPLPGLVGYKMRFEDKTNPSTKIKIMTDGILLQEMKLDPQLSKYACLVIDEAHERSLNIDFILGLLKRILESRPEFKVIVSSATINAQVFSDYFDSCPIVKIDAVTYPVNVHYTPLNASVEKKAAKRRMGFESDRNEVNEDIFIARIYSLIEKTVEEGKNGDILVFLSGERFIKDCMESLVYSPIAERLHVLPLYGRLSKEEQERVFDGAPPGKIKVVIATNIAETSITIDGITTVIDSGLSKLNFYNSQTYTSSLVEGLISKSSAEQRKGRAGRTRAGDCYRLYSSADFEKRAAWTVEEIYRTDLSEVILRMADLGVSDFENFDFISPPSRDGILAAIETLKMLDALEDGRSLSNIGKMMTEFPLAPRHARIIVEAILSYPHVLEETIIAAAFLSTHSPYLLPAGEEFEARRMHHLYRDSKGDFVSYLKLYRAYRGAANKTHFCEKNYLDVRITAEIANIVDQLGEIVSRMGVPILSHGSIEDYLCCISKGMIQFVCKKDESGSYRSLTERGIVIHPGSVMAKSEPSFIVAGEVVRTSRMYAMSVSPLTKKNLASISKSLFDSFVSSEKKRDRIEMEIAKKPRQVKEPRQRRRRGGARKSLEGKTFRANDDELFAYFPQIGIPIENNNDKKTELLCLNSDDQGTYWFSSRRDVRRCMIISLASIENLFDDLDEDVDIGLKSVVSETYRRLSDKLRGQASPVL
ncbi:MAG: ATP-dependent RNA helicase [Treponema sp.]|jgi:RNA helicase HrpA|nr:ATP-dependent RNA helicase [Treponema sp.]